MQNINEQDAETFQGLDFQSFQYGDFTLISDDVIALNSQSAITDNNHTALAVNHLNHHNSHTALLVNHLNPQNQEYSVCWNSSKIGDEIFENFSNINLPEQILPSYPMNISWDVKSDFNKDDVLVISKEEFIQKGNEEPKKCSAQKNEIHNQQEKNRRNAIKDKINTLRKLLPVCNKTDQASILSDVVDYVKCLQCQHQMLSMAYMPYLLMGRGIGMVNMCGHLTGGTRLPFQYVTSSHTPNMSVFTKSNIVSYSQFKPSSASLYPVTFGYAQALPTANSTFGTSTLVRPQMIPYTVNHAQQGESSTSQYNTNGIMDNNQNVPTPGEEYKMMANCAILPHSGP